MSLEKLIESILLIDPLDTEDLFGRNFLYGKREYVIKFGVGELKTKKRCFAY